MKHPRGGDWNYTGNPADSDRDWVRAEIGDVNSSEMLQSDQEIAAALASEPSRLLAAAKCCDRIAAQCASLFASSKSDGAGNTETQQRQQKFSHYRKLAADLRTRNKEGGGGTGTPYAGGISRADNEAKAADTDRVTGGFYTGMLSHQ